jgi:hypothetical protein
MTGEARVALIDFAGWTGSARIIHDEQGAYFTAIP